MYIAYTAFGRQTQHTRDVVVIINYKMQIQYRYKLLNSERIQTIVLTESEYYDPIWDQENYEDNAVPKYNDSRNYQPEIDKMLFEWDELIIFGSIKNDKVIKTEYFAEGKSNLTYRNDANGYELIIQAFLISSKDIYISRMERNGINEPWVNTNFNLGANFEGGDNEKWYNLKKGELKNDNTM